MATLGGLGLWTDLYQLTMAYGYWKLGRHREEVCFQHFFRKHPFGGGFALACGLEDALQYLEGLRFEPEERAYLAGLQGHDGKPLFEPDFLAYLGGLRFTCRVDAVPEGTVVFAHEPLLRVTGPVLEAQLVESALLCLVNFQTLVATKAARVCLAAGEAPVLEFGLRRAQGLDGSLSASRAAFVGGCAATSNVLAGKRFGIPVRGTHAHSWVMLFDSEPEAFEAYARCLPNNCVFLVDTYDTLEGVQHAIRAAEGLRARGHRLLGVRLDSGDLAFLSREARRLLDEAGFPEAAVLASNDLDEQVIQSLHAQGAAIAVFGVGTRLVTGHPDGALGGVYKLSAVRGPDGVWRPRVKLSEQAVKVTNPGVLQVRRFRAPGEALAYEADAIYDLHAPPAPGEDWEIVDPLDPTRQKRLSAGAAHEELLVPVMEGGRRLRPPEPLPVLQARTRAQLEAFHAGVKRFLNPHRYPVGLERSLHEHKTARVLAARGLSGPARGGTQ
jgi:nicotinate phosphoribosyltransferase